MKRVIAICVFVIIGSFSVYSQSVSPAKRQDILKLIGVTDAKAQMAQSFDMMFTNVMIATGSNIPEDVKRTIKSKFESRINEFVDLLIPIYDKHFTHDDIKQIIRFYETPAGKKMIKTTPLITQESFTAGQKWGQDMAQDILTEIMKLQK